MKAATANLQALLGTVNTYMMEDVLTLDLSNGNAVTFTTMRANAPATQPIFKRGGVRTQIGVEVSTMSVDLLCNSGSLIDGSPAIAFAAQGGLDGANGLVLRYFYANAQAYRDRFLSTAANAAAQPSGNLHIFQGRIGELNIDASGVHFTVASDMELLNIQLPRNLYQAGCIHDLYDVGCGVVAANFTATANVAANATVYTVPSDLTQNTGYFDLGVMEFTTGALAGVFRSVKQYDQANGAVTPVLPLPSAPAPGDQFVIKPGCDKTFATCNTVFTNTANFRGYEFIPTPETSY